ncbi:BppU family phage baseplate upper protein [Weissella confusa]|uniref:BppU family phage baseplate upper protein n=1 Tax=Weissella confusa TaxID=1583 RepID=UPI001C6F6405|nr:BppU family phage baseplate upper protein [Weissella confusa]QYU58217.1 BppU family phage baseplate upper protein [Weissella confusa]
MTEKILKLDVGKTLTVRPIVRLRRNDRSAFTMNVEISKNGQPMDISGYAIQFEGRTSRNNIIMDKTGVSATDEKNGKFGYTFPAKALVDIGRFKDAYFSFTKNNERETTGDFSVFVLEAADISQMDSENYLSDYEKMLQELNEIYTDLNIDDIENNMSTIRSDMKTLQKDIANEIEQIRNEVQKVIAQIDDTLATKDVAIRGENNTFTSSNTFEQPIIGALATREVPFDDLAVVANGGMTKYAGNFCVTDETVANSPYEEDYNLEIYPGISESTGYIRAVSHSNSEQAFTSVNNGEIVGWIKVANDDDVMHKTGNETIEGDKTFTGVLYANDVNGDRYDTPVTATANYFGSTITFVRIGKQVNFSSDTSQFTSAVAVGNTANVIPDGFKPAIEQNISAVAQDGTNKYFAFNYQGGIYSYSAYSSGTQPRISGSYITTDAWPN